SASFSFRPPEKRGATLQKRRLAGYWPRCRRSCRAPRRQRDEARLPGGVNINPSPAVAEGGRRCGARWAILRNQSSHSGREPMPKSKPRNALYAQSGGVTAVTNASACGVIETCRRNKAKIGKVFAGRHGVVGVLQEDLIDVGKESAAAIRALRHTPSGAFGSARYKLKKFEDDPAQYERLIEVFQAHDIGYFFYNGGGDSADTCLKISQLADKLGYPIQAIHVPKTVDNDLPITDCCPGFGSVAKYVAVSIREAGFDVASMAKTSTKVFILEVMGRHAG